MRIGTVECMQPPYLISLKMAASNAVTLAIARVHRSAGRAI